MLEKIAKWTLLDRVRLTYPSLIKMTIFMLGCTALLAWWNMRSDLGRTIYENAERRYELRGFAQGEAYLSRHLEKNPDDKRAWIMLVRKRGLVDAVVAGGGFDKRSTGPGLTRHAEFYRPLLSEAEFNEFLKRCRVLSPVELTAWRRSRANYTGALQLLTAAAHSAKSSKQKAGYLNTAGRISYATNKFEDAARYFKQAVQLEGDQPDHRLRALRALARLKYLDELSTLMEDPAYFDAADAPILRAYYTHRGEFLKAAVPLFRHEAARYSGRLVVAALLSGAGWFLFCLHMGRVLETTQGRWKYLLLSVTALGLGGLSTYPTVWLVLVQDTYLQHDARGGDFLYNLLYNILGIGLREEAMKLLLFLPLVPFLSGIRDKAVLLTIASLVGLGFAIEENVSYYSLSRGGAVAARFLTANFFHLALTGLAGYRLIRAFQGERQGWKEFGETFALVVVCHGAYDFLLSEPTLRGLEFFSYTVYIWLAWQFLGLMSAATLGGRRGVSLTRVFIIALVTAIGVNYIMVSEWLGFWRGFLATMDGLLGVLILTVMFFREFNEPVAWK